MLGWIMLILVLLIVLAWDFSAKWAALRHRVVALTIRVDVSEELRMEAQEQHHREEEEMQESIWRLVSKVSALQSRVEALTGRLDVIEEPKGHDPKMQAVVDRFMSSFRA